MSLSKFNEDVNNVQTLPNQPTISAEELKRVFDQAGIDIKEYLNTILTEEIDTLIRNMNNGKAPNNHAVNATTYGLGKAWDYGHVRVVDALTKTEYADGESLSAHQGNVLDGKINALKSTATTSANGLMSSGDKTKLNGIETGATKNTATATTSANGLMSSSDKTKLNGIATGANKTEIANNLTTTATGKALDATQGKALNDRITNNSEQIDNNYDTLNDRIESSVNTAKAEIYNRINNLSSVSGNFTVPNDLHVNRTSFIDGEVRSNKTYSYKNVTSAPNLYIADSGYIRRSTNTSSQRYKKDIKELSNEDLNPEKLYDLKVRQFKYKEDFQPDKSDSRYNKDLVGFIAEEVAEVYPIAVDYNEKGQVDNWNERYMIPPMLAMIQNLKREIDELKEKLK